MAPPPPDAAKLPIKERLIALAQTLQFAWFVGHVILIACTVRYSMSLMRFNWNGGMATFVYRLSFIAAVETYGIVVYKNIFARSKKPITFPGGVLALIADENVQYLLMTIVWLFSPQYPFAVFPYSIYSFFHILVYTRGWLIPCVQPPKRVPEQADADPAAAAKAAANPTTEAIGVFIKKYYEASMKVVSSLEILIWVRLLLAAVLFARRSWIMFGIYTIFLRGRYAQSIHTQQSFSKLEAQIDSLVSNPSTPPAARQAWEAIKGAARSFYAVTDTKQYLGRPASSPTAPKTE
jgi:hypothetical protein